MNHFRQLAASAATSGDFLERTVTSPPILAQKAALDAVTLTAKLSQLEHKAPLIYFLVLCFLLHFMNTQTITRRAKTKTANLNNMHNDKQWNAQLSRK